MTRVVTEVGMLGPIAWVVLGAFAIAIGERALSRRDTLLGRPVTPGYVATVLGLLALVCLAMSGLLSAAQFADGAFRSFMPTHPRLRLDPYSALLSIWIVIAAALCCALALTQLGARKVHFGDFYALLLLATAGALVAIQAIDWVALFLGLELMGLPIVALVGFDARSRGGQEAAMKLVVSWGLASATGAYGMALLYGAAGATDFAAVRESIANGSALAAAGSALVVASFAARLGTVPFHANFVDAADGALRPVTAFLFGVAVVAAAGAMIRVMTLGIAAPDGASVLRVMGVTTGVLGAAMATGQVRFVRWLAYLGIAVAGFLWAGLAAGTGAIPAVLLGLVAHASAIVGALAVAIAISQQKGHDSGELSALAGLAQVRPGLATLLTLFLFTIAGVPGTGGFTARWMLGVAVLQRGDFILAGGLGVISALLFVAVARCLRDVWFVSRPAETAARVRLATGEALVLGFCAALVLSLGIAPSGGWPAPLSILDVPVLSWIESAATAGLTD